MSETAATTETQEPPEGSEETTPKTYDEEYVKKIRGEAAAWRTKLREREAEFETLTSRVSELEEKAGKADSADAILADKDREIARLSVALDKGLPANLAARLVGDNAEELAKDADNLLTLLGEREQEASRNTDLGQGPRGDGKPKVTMNDALRALAGR